MPGRIAELLEMGAYYDELTEDEKNAYCTYYGTDRETLEEVSGLLLGTLHFKLERSIKATTEAQFRECVREAEGSIQALQAEYNAPEARARREAGYKDLQRAGALRKAAFDRGEDMSKYPLPWKGTADE